MPQINVARRMSTELLAAIALPLLVLGILAVPFSAAAVAEVDRTRARLCGMDATALQPEAQTRPRWLWRRARTRSVWRIDLPVFIGALILSVLSLLMAFFGFIGAVALVFSPAFWFAGIPAQVGPFTPGAWWQSVAAVPVGAALGAVTAGLLVAVSVARNLLLRAVTHRDDPAQRARLEELRASRAALGAAFEVERRRIERDLHDGAQQELVAVVMRLGLLEAAAEGTGDERMTTLARSAREQAERALVRLRETVRDIHPRELSDLGLIAAVRELATRSPLRIELDGKGDDTLLAAPTAAAVYFTVSEAVTNIAKHSGSDLARIDLRFSGGAVRAAVLDEGAGGARIDEGSGLAGLRERMRSVGGDLEVQSPAGGGTLVVATAPGSDGEEWA
ncbi:sensor histidine kinase [Tomitella cavernea]|nr:histidine kinase [Tomitella cavernea]